MIFLPFISPAGFGESGTLHAELHRNRRACGECVVELDAFGGLRQRDRGKALQPLVIGDPLLDAGEIGAGAEMLAAAESDMLAELAAIVIERGRTGELAIVAIGARGSEENLRPRLDGDTADLNVFRTTLGAGV